MAVQVFCHLILLAACIADTFGGESECLEGTQPNVDGFQVVGGQMVTSCSQFPWLVNLGTANCLGTILDKKHIITAAHCIKRSRKSDPTDASQISVYIGSAVWGNGTRVGLEKHFIHPNFKFGRNHMLDNDIAILRLAEEIKFDKCQRPVCLSKNGDTDYYTEKECIFTSWPTTATGSRSTLKWMKMKVETDENCMNIYSGYYRSSAVCADDENKLPGQGVCFGDSGAPLLCKNGGKWRQYGLVSQRKGGCGEHPGLFESIPFYYNWIRTTVNSP